VNSNKDTYNEETIDKAKSVAESFINANFKEVTTGQWVRPPEQGDCQSNLVLV